MNWRIAWLVMAAAWMLPTMAPAAQDLETRYKQAAETFHGLRDKTPDNLPGWRRVAASFYAIYETRARHPRGADGLFSAALSLRAAYQRGGNAADRTRSVAWFRQFVRMYPGHKLADDSLMHIGALYALNGLDPESAYETYLKVLTDYPRGDQAALARQFTDELAEQEPRPAVRPVVYRATASVTSEPAISKAPFSKAPLSKAPLSKDPLSKGAAVAPSTSVSQGGSKVGTPQGDASEDSFDKISSKPAGPAGRKNSTDPVNTDAPALLKGIEYWAMQGWTRVVLTLDRSVSYMSRKLPAAKGRPPRFYLDLKGTTPALENMGERVAKDSVLNKIRLSRRADGATRVVLDLKKMGRVQVKNIALPREKKIFIDLYPPPAPPARPGAKTLKARLAKNNRQGTAARSLKTALGLKVKTIVLDPGHGGHDPGAVAFGLLEKRVALDIAKRLRAAFKKNRPDIKVLLTREDDVFIPLEKRPQLAQRMGADLFVSIHLNANTEERFSGVETYFLNLTTDASALRVAARENATGKMQVGDLNQILRDLLRDTNIVESGKLASDLQGSLVSELRHNSKVRNLGVKQAPFMVLIGSEVPGVLVEAGFLTNRKENKRLRDRQYLNRIADGIYEGLRKYIDKQDVVLELNRSKTSPRKS